MSDTRLLPGDPVVGTRCAGDGLIVRASSGAMSLRLDLGGQTLRGQGRGVGIRIISAGESSAVIVGGDPGQKAVIANFRDGIRAAGPRGLRELRDVQLSGNSRDGVRARTIGGVLSGVQADRNGHDGIRVGGRSPRLDGIEAQRNGRYGVLAPVRGAEVSAKAVENGAGDVRVRAALPAGGAR